MPPVINLHLGDNREVLATLEPNSIDSIVTDPPYELSDDGKASAYRVFSEFMFPKHPKINTLLPTESNLSFLLNEILELSRVRAIPCIASAMPEGSMTFDYPVEDRNKVIEYIEKCAVLSPNGLTVEQVDTQSLKRLANSYFELADFAQLAEIFNEIGCGFFSGGIGIGFCLTPASFPGFLSGSSSIAFVNDDVRLLDNTFSHFVSAGGRAEDFFVSRFDLSRGTIEFGSTYAALAFFAGLELAGAKLVTTSTRTGGLPSVLKPSNVCFVINSTNRALSIYLLVHKVNIQNSGFMGKGWDGSKIAFDVELWRECLRVLKPGGYLLAFGGSRTYHRLACAIEDAGFEIRDQIMWLYGSGFPKSLNLEGDHQGKGTALKPAHEPIVVARKPLIGTVQNNVDHYGTGALNIDVCRIEFAGQQDLKSATWGRGTDIMGGNYVGATHSSGRTNIEANPTGRWPANVIHDGSLEVITSFPVTSSGKPSGLKKATNNVYGQFGTGIEVTGYGDSGSAARFFYCAKADRKDRDEGCKKLADTKGGMVSNTSGQHITRRDEGYKPKSVKNNHPTVKPTSLMQYLCRLVTPPGGTVLDPFMGSGSTGKAAVKEGLSFTGIELLDEHYAIAQARIKHAQDNYSLQIGLF